MFEEHIIVLCQKADNIILLDGTKCCEVENGGGKNFLCRVYKKL